MTEAAAANKAMANSAIRLDARETLALDLSGIKLIEASAGTGKTYAIANLYLRYVIEGCQVNQLLVVTFTNAATEELRGRVRQRLHETLQLLLSVQNGESPEQVTTDAFLQGLLGQLSTDEAQLQSALLRLRLAVRSMDEAAIHTIHGFCQRALSDHAFHSGQAYEVTLLQDDSALWTEAIKDWWRREVYELDPVHSRLFVSALGSVQAFINRQKPLRYAGDKRVFPERSGSLDALYARWSTLLQSLHSLTDVWLARHEELCEALLTSKALSRSAKGGYKNELLEQALDELHDWFLNRQFDVLPDSLSLLAAERIRDNCKPSQRGKDAGLEDGFFEECQLVLDERVAIEQAFLVTALYQVSDYASQRIEEEKTKQRLMSFSDQLMRLHEALRGAQGPALAASLRQAFPVAMIDEFQDTDSIQYAIFRALYFDGPAVDPGALHRGLIMIGDPKQAIYSFRGGDIFTYMQARRDAADQLYTLDTNWRSVPSLIQAVNCIFDRRDEAFVYDDAIRFEPVSHATNKTHKPLQENGEAQIPFTLWRIPYGDKDKPLGKGAAESALHEATAAEIQRLIAGGQQKTITLGEEPVEAGDIAVLVREKHQGHALRRLLMARGIPAVTVSDEKVFQSGEAQGLLLLLLAVSHCDERERLRESLASSLLGYRYTEIGALVDDEKAWLDYVGTLHELHALWSRKGFMVMFQSMMQRLGIGRVLARGPDAERSLTNVLHLAELLQQNARSHPGMDALLAWLREQIREATEDEAELRLESDEKLVKIVTIHASKGLQYPIVFAPYLSTCRPVDTKRGALVFHDQTGQACLDISPSPVEAHHRLAEKERLAEDVRLLYVALTRAEAKLYLAWGELGQRSDGVLPSSRSALAWLLYPKQRAEDLDLQLPDAIGDSDNLQGPLTSLVRDSDQTMELMALPGSDAPAIKSPKQDGSGLMAARFTGQIATDWRIASFSALTRDVHQAPHGGSARREDPIINFPAGSHVGLFLHSLLEEMDFQGDVPGRSRELVRRHAPRYGLDIERHEDTVVNWMQEVVNTPLDEGKLTLSALSMGQRLDEIEFDFSVQSLPVHELNRVLSELSGRELEPIRVEDFSGLINGIIDLVFEHEGRFYIADYKSNYLGGQLSDYAPAALDNAVHDRRYDLQYWLYVLALHRYLQQRLPDYDYDRHMGGIYYLFLRGMRAEHGNSYGVFHRHPKREAVERLHGLMGGAS